MVFLMIQISFITGLAALFLYLNQNNKSGLNTKLISLSFLICLLVPLINELPINVPTITINNKWNETIVNSPKWQKKHQNIKPINNLNTPIYESENHSLVASKTNPFNAIGTWLFYIWITGILIQFINKYIQHRKLKHIVLTGKPLNSAGLRSTLKVITSEHAEVPFLFVYKKAYIVIPEEVKSWERSHQLNIIAHEQCHFQRKDHWHLWVANILTTIYWFHPLIKYLSDRQNIEIEAACDQQLIKNGIDRISYAETLLAFVNNSRNSSSCASMATKPKLIELRIRSVLNQTTKSVNHSKKSYLALITVVLMSLGCADLKQITWLSSAEMITFVGHDLPTMRNNELAKNQVLISAFYDGKANDQTHIHLEIKNAEDEASWLALAPLKKFNEYIHTWHFELKNTSQFTGKYKVFGAEGDGVIDGVALGVLAVDSTGGIELLKTKSKLSQDSTPNIVCAWPLGISEVEFLRVLPQLTYNSPDAVERILCGSQLVQNGQHQLN